MRSGRPSPSASPVRRHSRVLLAGPRAPCAPPCRLGELVCSLSRPLLPAGGRLRPEESRRRPRPGGARSGAVPPPRAPQPQAGWAVHRRSRGAWSGGRSSMVASRCRARGAVEVGEHLQGGRRGGQEAGHGGAAGWRLPRSAARRAGPARVGVPAVQVGTAQAAGRPRDDERADDAGLAPDGRHQVRHAAAVDLGDERIGGGPGAGEDDEVRGVVADSGRRSVSGLTRRTASAAASARGRPSSAAPSPPTTASPRR